jgi:signal transduction histidine kinase
MDAFLRTESVSIEDLVDRLRAAVPPVALVGTPGIVISCDSRKTARALADIVRNAWQAGAAHVRLDVRRSGPMALLRIVDDGPGISREVVDRLFSPGLTHGKPQGHGIGLFSARWILEAMGGSVRLERSDATGTSFLVSLPLADREA